MKAIKKCLELCNDELKKIESCKAYEATYEQIREIVIPDLYKLLDLIEDDNIPKKTKRKISSFICICF